MSHLSNQNMITLKVRIDERILHSAVLHIIAQRFINYSRIEEETDPEIEKKVKYCLLKNGNLRVSEEKKTNYEERLIREKREWNEEYVQPRRKKRYSTPPSVLKQKMVFSDRERDRRYARHDDQLQQYRGYLDLTYYDLSFILKSDHLNIPTELKALHAVYRYGIKVLNDPGVANRLIKCIRFSYLELSDIMNVARSNLKFFSNSKEFQNKLS